MAWCKPRLPETRFLLYAVSQDFQTDPLMQMEILRNIWAQFFHFRFKKQCCQTDKDSKLKWPKTWKTYLNGKKREICAIAFVFLTLKGKEMRWKQFESTCIISCNGMLNLVDKSIVYKIWSYTYWNWKWLWFLRANEINLWNGCGGFSVNF